MSTTHSNTLAPAGPAMWWDGGERAITAREKARIEEHGPSCFSIALVPATPSARWAADALADPHGDRYACERAALTLGNLTDDELANAVFLHGNEQPTMADLAAGKALAGIVYLTAAKERIRWLSRALVDATCKQPLQVGEVQGDARAQFEAWAKGEGWKDDQLTRYSGGRCTTAGEYHNSHLEALWYGWKSALAARQPGAQEPVGFQIMRRSADDTCFNGRWDNPPSGFHDDREYYVSRPGTYRIRDIYVAPPAQADHPYQRITGLQGIGDAADYLARHPGDDYAHRHLSERVMEFCQKHGVSPAQGIDLAARPMDTAPRDGTLVRLLVDFDENAIEDSISATWTIGACNDDNVSEGARIGWQFAGWCWTHDHFTEGTGTPVGWLPLIDGQRDAAPGVSP